jgi:ABC-type branched-subunit amino acid transport system ATPase component
MSVVQLCLVTAAKLTDEPSIGARPVQTNHVESLIRMIIAEDVVQVLMALHYKICNLLLTSKHPLKHLQSLVD